MKDLLGLLTEKAGCEYISDLPSRFKEGITQELLYSIPNEEFTAEAWSDASSYILQHKLIFSSVTDAKEYLCNHFALKK